MREVDKKLAEALGETKAKSYMSLNNNRPAVVFAEKSKFFKQVMDDGYVFNPYIHRRWLPVQYNQLVENTGSLTIPEKIAAWYNYGYSIKFVLEEVDKMCTLSKYDRAAFDERKNFFTIETVKSILLNYIVKFESFLPRDKTGVPYFWTNLWNCYINLDVDQITEFYEGTDWFGMKTIKARNVYNVSQFRDRIDLVKKSISEAVSYYEIQKAINMFPQLRLRVRMRCKLDTQFIEGFWKAGAYYSIKHKIMFEKKALPNGKTGHEAYEEIREMLEEGATAELFHNVYALM